MGIVSLVAAGMSPSVHAQQTAEIVEFDIPAQELSNALKSYGVAADRQVLFAVNLVRGKHANAVSGQMQPDIALEHLLMGSGLAYETTASDVVVIKTAERDASVGQMIRAAPVEKDDIGGITVPDNEGDVPQQLEEIVVTGTNIRGVQNPTVPILEFDREDIELSGAATVEEFLRTVPQNLSSINAVTSNSADNFTAGNTGNFGTGVNLRGLGAGTTLTLLNGRRMTATGGDSVVDVSVLPLGAIERVEILTDGASAIYGSDAVAGVVNFVTRTDYEGFEVRGRYGTVTEGSKEEYQIGTAGGVNWGSGGAIIGLEYSDVEPLLVREAPNVDLSNPVFADSRATLGASTQLFSATASFNQGFTDRLRLSADGLYSTNESSFINNPGLFNVSEESQSAEGVAYFLNTQLEYDVADSITAELFYDYSRSETDRDGDGFETPLDFYNSLTVLEGKLSGRVLRLPSGDDLSFAFGSAYREESYENTADRLFERDVTAVYGELLIPLIGESNALPFVKAFDVSIAGRYEDYSDFGETFNPKFGLRWGLGATLSLMASYSQSFRAPDLNDIGSPGTFFTFAAPNSFFLAFPEISSDPTGQTILLEVSGSGTDLAEETADVWSIGLEYEPGFIEGFSLTSTYFLYDYADRIEGVGNQDILFDTAFSQFANPSPSLEEVQGFFDIINAGGVQFLNLANAVPEDVDFITFTGLQNAAQRKVEGIDLTASYEKDTSAGLFTASTNVAYLLTYETQITDASPVLYQLNTLYRPIDLRLRGNLSWSKDGLTVFAAVNHTSGYRDLRDRSLATDIDAFTTFDFSLTYDASGRLGGTALNGTAASFGMRNLFDEEPPFVETIDGLNYDSANGNPFGRQISVSLTKSF